MEEGKKGKIKIPWGFMCSAVGGRASILLSYYAQSTRTRKIMLAKKEGRKVGFCVKGKARWWWCSYLLPCLADVGPTLVYRAYYDYIAYCILLLL